MNELEKESKLLSNEFYKAGESANEACEKSKLLIKKLSNIYYYEVDKDLLK